MSRLSSTVVSKVKKWCCTCDCNCNVVGRSKKVCRMVIADMTLAISLRVAEPVIGDQMRQSVDH